ncbi:MAG: hypothetical protein NTU41_06015 [Chloroflexi bacterium]|nr:hypothetical protein [Chloroflexota bacterium]
MKRNTKIKLMAIVAAAVALVALVLTTTVFASSSSSSATSLTNNTRQDFIDKVASNLGLTSDQVTAAFDKAQNQTLDEQIQERLQEAVTNGTITQEESDQILEWWTSRPDALSKLGMRFLGQGGTGMGGEGIGSRGGNGCPMRRGSEANIEDRVSGTVASIDAAGCRR